MFLGYEGKTENHWEFAGKQVCTYAHAALPPHLSGEFNSYHMLISYDTNSYFLVFVLIGIVVSCKISIYLVKHLSILMGIDYPV